MRIKRFRFSSIILLLYCLSLSWNSAFKVAGITVPMIFSFIIILLFFSGIIFSKFKFTTSARQAYHLFPPRDFILFFILTLMLANAVPFASESSIVRIGLFIYVSLAYLSFKGLVALNELGTESIIKFICIGVLTTSIFIIFEFMTRNFTGFQIQLYIPRTREATAMLGGVIARPYGFSTEPNIIAFYFNSLSPLAIYYIFTLKVSTSLKLMLSSAIIFAFILLLSPTIIFLLAAAFGWKILTLKRSLSLGPKVFALLLSVPLIMVAGLFVIGQYIDLDLVLSSFYRQITLIDQQERQEKVAGALSLWLNSAPVPFGLGQGHFREFMDSSPINFYVMQLVEGGVPNALLFLLFILFNAVSAFRAKTHWRAPIFVGLVASSLHLLTTSTYHNPFLWVLVGVLCLLKSDNINSIEYGIRR